MFTLFLMLLSQVAYGASMPKTSPSAKPVSKPAHGVEVKPVKGMQKVKISPNKSLVSGPTSFSLSRSGGKLILSFTTTDPQWELSQDKPLVIQLIPMTGSMELNPSLITWENWPKGAKQITISYKGAAYKKENQIAGGAAYRICSTKTHECKKVKTQIRFNFVP